MKACKEIRLRDFDFWGGAKEIAELITSDEFDEIEEYMEDISDIWDETEINDFFWFDTDWIAKFLDYEDEEEFWNERHKSYMN